MLVLVLVPVLLVLLVLALPGSCCRGGRSYIADEKRAVRGILPAALI